MYDYNDHQSDSYLPPYIALTCHHDLLQLLHVCPTESPGPYPQSGLPTEAPCVVSTILLDIFTQTAGSQA